MADEFVISREVELIQARPFISWTKLPRTQPPPLPIRSFFPCPLSAFFLEAVMWQRGIPPSLLHSIYLPPPFSLSELSASRLLHLSFSPTTNSLLFPLSPSLLFLCPTLPDHRLCLRLFRFFDCPLGRTSSARLNPMLVVNV